MKAMKKMPREHAEKMPMKGMPKAMDREMKRHAEAMMKMMPKKMKMPK